MAPARVTMMWEELREQHLAGPRSPAPGPSPDGGAVRRAGHLAEHGLRHVLAEAGAGPAQRRPDHPREGPAARGCRWSARAAPPSYDSRANRHKARTKCTTGLAGKRRRR
ncbi:hypothetical protein LT493_27020 [Streptomyces tricolor]|nr:hypothetical protein [Streptomyces tricolor]